MYRVYLGDSISVEIDPSNNIPYLITTHPVAVGDRLELNADSILKTAELLREYRELQTHEFT